MLPEAPALTPARGEPSLPVQPQPGANPTLGSAENTLMETCSAPCVKVVCPTVQKARGGTCTWPQQQAAPPAKHRFPSGASCFIGEIFTAEWKEQAFAICYSPA